MTINPPIVDLDYDDPFEPTIAVDNLLADARRAKRTRRASKLGAVVIGHVVITLAAGTVRGHGGQPSLTLAQVAMTDPVYQLHQPSDSLVIVDQSLPHWTTFAYLSTDNQICGGSAATSGNARGHVAVTCWMSADQPLTGAWIAKAAFQALPQPSDNHGQVLALGLLRCKATSVDMTFLGHSVSAPVVPLNIRNQSNLGVYVAWLPLGTATTYGTNDITELVAKDGANVTACQLA
jgi:hypothetical protein